MSDPTNGDATSLGELNAAAGARAAAATRDAADILALLLRDEGFTRVTDTSPVIQHCTTGVLVACNDAGIRLTFHSPVAARGIGIIDFPADIAYGTVAHVALAMRDNAIQPRHPAPSSANGVQWPCGPGLYVGAATRDDVDGTAIPSVWIDHGPARIWLDPGSVPRVLAAIPPAMAKACTLAASMNWGPAR